VRKIYVLSLALLVAAMMALPANAAMWVGGEIGANFITDTDLTAGVVGTLRAPRAVAGQTLGAAVKFSSVSFEPAVFGGLTVGYDFVNTGFAGYDWPSWMKYFGVIVDFSYNRVAVRNQFLPVSGAVTINGANRFSAVFPNGVGHLFDNTGDTSNGCIPTLSFMVYGHYGFFPDSVVPIGRVHPYLAVGPAVAWTALDLGPYGLGTQTSTNIALAAEGGVRFILLPNVTWDIGLRYRYLVPSAWTASGNVSVAGYVLSPGAVRAQVDSINAFTVLTRVNYHF